MRYLTFLFSILILIGVTLKGQTIIDSNEGSISFLTSQSIYVKFQSTQSIEVGDTLYISQDSTMIPILKVTMLSSISCVCTPIGSVQLLVGDKIYTTQKNFQTPNNKVDDILPTPIDTIPNADSVLANKTNEKPLKQRIGGRFSISAYSNISNKSDNTYRFRYNLSLNVQNINNSKFSTDTYISFAHKLDEWSDIQNNIYNGLKIYSLAINYAINKDNSLWVGRKINPSISNVGAIDGMQYETNFKRFNAGVFAGSRPDYIDYSFNASLLQFGGYIGHNYSTKKGTMQSSVALVEQMNSGNTDRRFAYFQHSNALLSNLYFFGSVEFDLYNKVLNTQDSSLVQDNNPNLSNLYFSVRYRVVKQLSLSASYSTRENIVYYETYKSIIEQLLDVTKMQGYTFQVNYAPTHTISLGANAGYRFSKKDPKPSKNLYSYLTYNNVPWLNASATISATLMQTSYLNGKIYSLGLTRDLVPGKLYGGLSYRYIDYNFVSNETPLVQNMAEMNLTWRILKKLSCSLNCEGTFEKGANFESIYVNVTQRF
ncbi:MAG: hypothetical protein WCX31_13270 [Salinivirgaceae bacterium]